MYIDNNYDSIFYGISPPRSANRSEMVKWP